MQKKNILTEVSFHMLNGVCVCQVSHQGVRRWLHHHRNEHMSGRAYRDHALAELSSIPSFDFRCASAHASDALKLKHFNAHNL